MTSQILCQRTTRPSWKRIFPRPVLALDRPNLEPYSILDGAAHQVPSKSRSAAAGMLRRRVNQSLRMSLTRSYQMKTSLMTRLNRKASLMRSIPMMVRLARSVRQNLLPRIVSSKRNTMVIILLLTMQAKACRPATVCALGWDHSNWHPVEPMMLSSRKS